MKLGGFKLSEMSQDTEDLRLTDLSVVLFYRTTLQTPES